MTLLLGAVAYDPKVVTIWEGFRGWLRDRSEGSGLEIDYVLYSHYERQVDDLLAGRIGVAWNSPLAWVRARRLAQAAGAPVHPVVMRDADLDLTSVVVVRDSSPIRALADLKGRVVATGAVDSPQATLLPLSLLRASGLTPGEQIAVRRFDVGVGLHGDHVGGERDAARALMTGEVDAACLLDGNLLAFAREGTFPAGAVRVLARTGSYDHCNMTAGPASTAEEITALRDLLLGMSYADPQLRPLLDLEGLKQWRPARTEGYALLERAVDESGFYDEAGALRAGDYRP